MRLELLRTACTQRELCVTLFIAEISSSLYGFQGATAVAFPSCEGGGDNEIRTHDPLLARQVLSQLSYTPMSAKRLPFRRRVAGWPLKIEYRMRLEPSCDS